MATAGKDNGGKGVFDQDPFVDQMRPEPSAPPSDAIVLEGLAGKSDRESWARLYFNRTLTYYAEFRREDITFTESIPPDQPPMLGLKGTRVGIKKDAAIEYTRATRAKTGDEFDLDIQFTASLPRATQSLQPATWQAECPGQSWGDCRTSFTCISCDETCAHTICRGACHTIRTCHTCQTQCDQNTCHTCRTQCNQNTCHTCRTQCNQDTCHTCGQATCGACNTHPFTCRVGCQDF